MRGTRVINETADRDFRDFVVASLTEMKTNLATAIGPDGNGGRLKEMRDEQATTNTRVDDLINSRERAKGAMWIVGILYAGLLSGAEWLIHRR
jgi:hypothetical protein